MAQNLADEIVQATQEYPCAKAADLYSVSARRILGRLMKEFLGKNTLTVTELLHRADMMKKVETTGTILQFVVQQVAVARASSEKRPVQPIIRELNDLADDLLEQVKEDKRKELFPVVSATGFDAFAAKIAGRPRATYILNGALARYLRDARSWSEKALRLISILELTRPDRPSGEMLLSAVDAIFAEMLQVPAALAEFIEAKPTFGDTVMTLIHLFLGRGDSKLYPQLDVLRRLAWHFGGGTLPLSRATVAAQIVTQLYSLQKLCNDSMDREMRVFREVTELVMSGLDDTLRKEDVLPALEIRSKRFVASEAISAGLANSVLPDEKLEWLFFAESCVIGVRNKQILAETAVRTAMADSFKTQFQWTSTPLPKRLQRLAALSTAARRTGFHDNDRRTLSNIFDAVALNLVTESKLFETIEARPASAAEKAVALLQLHEAETFTEGRLTDKVRDAVIGYLSSPGFLDGYVERFSGTTDKALSELTFRVQKIGLTPEDVRELIAA